MVLTMAAIAWLLCFSILGVCSFVAGLARKEWAPIAIVLAAIALGLVSPHRVSVTVTALLVPVVVSVLLHGAVHGRVKPNALLGGGFAVLGQFLLVAVASRWVWLLVLPVVLVVMRLGKRIQPQTAMWLLGVPVAISTCVLLAALR